MRFLLDTNAVIGLLNGRESILERLRQHAPDDFGLPAIVAHELFYGAFKSQRVTENLARIDGVRFEVLSFDAEDARQSGDIRAQLAAIGSPIGAYDVLIAGQAKARELILVTHNVGEFRRVQGLQIEDWES